MPGGCDVAHFRLAERLKRDPLGAGFFGVGADGGIGGAAGQVTGLFQAAVISLSVGVDAEELVFFAGAARGPCDLTLHARCIPGEKCQGIQIAANDEAVEVFLLGLGDSLPSFLDSIEVDVGAGQVSVADNRGFQALLGFGFDDRFLILAECGVDETKIAVRDRDRGDSFLPRVRRLRWPFQLLR